MTTDCIVVDGSMGEGGGQVLRASLALSMALGKPFHMKSIRANRPKPGLKRQHLTCVQAAKAICNATTEGADINSTELSFAPGPVRPGEYRFDIGSGGSASLVLQAIMPPLLFADGPSAVTVTGGTHVPFAPPFEFMRDTLFPHMEKLGVRLDASMERPGFMQVGGGTITATIRPASVRHPLHIDAPGAMRSADAVIYCHNIPDDVIRRETTVLLSRPFAGLNLTEEGIRLERTKVRHKCPEGAGNAVLVSVRREQGATVFGEIGWRGRTAEIVARQAAKRALQFIESGASVERHLADQLLVPMALAGGGEFTAETLTPHTRTCLDLLPQFMDIAIDATPIQRRAVRIRLELQPI